MWWRVCLLEWSLFRRERGNLVMLGLFCALVVMAGVSGRMQVDRLEEGFDRIERRYAETEAQYIAKLKNAADAALGSSDPRDPFFMGRVGASQLAILPLDPLSAFGAGERDALPQIMKVSMGPHLTPELDTEAAMVGPSGQLVGAFDLVFLFIVILPLIVIGNTFGILSLERERGTLAMLLSQPLSQWELVIGKCVGRLTILAVVLLMFLVLGTLASGIAINDASVVLKILGFFALLVSWLVFWLGICVWVNALGLSSANNALSLVGIWLLVVVIVPGGIRVALDSALPLTSQIELLHEQREATQLATARIDDLTGRHDGAVDERAYARKIIQLERSIARDTKEVFEQAHAVEQERTALRSALFYLSPASLLANGFLDLTGNGHQRYSEFETQAEEYQQSFTGFFHERIDADKQFGVQDFHLMPRFSFKEEALGSLFFRVSRVCLLLVCIGLFGCWLSVPRLRSIGRLTR